MFFLLVILSLVSCQEVAICADVPIPPDFIDITEVIPQDELILRLSLVVDRTALDVADSVLHNIVNIVDGMFDRVTMHIDCIERVNNTFSDTDVAEELLAEARLFRLNNPKHFESHATILITTRSMNFVGMAYRDESAQALFCNKEYAVGLVKVDPLLQAFTASIFAHELGHLWGLIHFDDGWPTEPYVMNTITVGGNMFSEFSLATLDLNIDVMGSAGCVPAKPVISTVIDNPVVNGNYIAGDVRVGFHMPEIPIGSDGFFDSLLTNLVCTLGSQQYNATIHTAHYAECLFDSEDGTVELTTQTGLALVSTPVTFAPRVIFRDLTVDNVQCTMTVTGYGFRGGTFFLLRTVSAPEDFTLFTVSAVSNTVAVLDIPPTAVNGSIEFAIKSAPWSPTGLVYTGEGCTLLDEWRCSDTVTCEENGYPGMCCSQANWCGDTPNHCGSGCKSGPCTGESTEHPLGSWRCSDTVTCEENGYPGMCCSQANWCGSSESYCGSGCKSGPCAV